MKTTTRYNEKPLAEAAPPSQNGHPAADGLESSKSAELSERLAQENKRLAQENARLSQEQARERSLLRTLIENLPDAIFAKDTAGRKTMANPADLKKLRCKTETEAIGKSDFDFYPKDVAEKFWATDQKVLQGQPIINQEGYFLNDNGEKRWQLTSKLPLRDQNGKITGLVGISRDITDQKQTEEAVRQSRDELEKRVAERTAELSQERLLLRTLIDSVPDSIYAKDTAGRKTMANLGDLKNLKCKTEAEVIGKTDFDFFPKDIAEKHWADDQKVLQGRSVINQEEQVLDENGKKRWLLTSKLPLRDPNGKITGLVGIGREITEHKRTEEALANEQALLHALVDHLPAAIYLKDLEGRKTLANRTELDYMGATSEAEVLGKTDFDFFPPEKAAVFRAHDQEIIRTGQPLINDESRFTKPDGTVIYLSGSTVPLRDAAGRVIGLAGINFDITDRRRAEESLRVNKEWLLKRTDELSRERLLLRTLLDSLPDAIYAKDAAGRKTMANPGDLSNLKCKAEAEVLGKSDFDFFPKDIAEKFQADDQKVMEGEPVINREEYFLSDKGEKRWLLTSKLPLHDQTGKVVGLVGIGRDITERKLVEDALRSSEEKLRQFAEQLERSNRELQDFAYVASHDLQEPLRKIVVFGERLKEKSSETLAPESLDYLDRMQKAAGRMQILINDLLTFSRVTTKAHPFAPVNLAETASEVVNDLEGRIELVKGRVELGALPVIDAEPLQMRQLLQNLIGNALKFRRPEEPPVVKVEAQIISAPDSPGKKLCQLSVSDNGIGFDEKYLDRIFNVFQRLHTRNEYEGTGMGLAIVRKIALHHGGDITAKSKPGQGASFILTLPVVHPKKTQDNNTETTTNTNKEN
jgi:PAS domain S-box-containing protein